MIEIPGAEQMRTWDSHTISGEGIKSIDLMERACVAFVNWFVTVFDTSATIGIVCGTGNNGGDGLGIARLLASKNYNVSVWIIKSQNQSEDFKTNRSRLPKSIPMAEISDATSVNFYRSVIIDAIFGTGLSRGVDGIYADVIKKLNATPAIKVAVDVPSGLMIDKRSSGEIVRADYTITFQVPKLAFMFPACAEFVGEWHAVDIGLTPGLFGNLKMNINNFYIDDRTVRYMIGKKKRKKFSHKGDFGRAFLVAGSYGKMGACVLAAKAALRSGAGLLTVHVPKCGYDIIQTSVPEAMASIDVEEHYFSDPGETGSYDVIGIGPGLGKTASTKAGLRKILQLGKPMVLDADALNIISEDQELLNIIPSGSILTPHPGEFQRLIGRKWTDDFHRLDLQRELANATDSVVVLKGAHTSIAAPHSAPCFNSTGNPGMAKGGSGDVLTGVLTGLLSQGFEAPDAAIIGVYIHGLAGDLAAARIGQNAIIASDLVDFLGQSFGS